MRREWNRTADDKRRGGVKGRREGLVTNQQVVVVLQEKEERSELTRESNRERAAQPAESRLPLKRTVSAFTAHPSQ